MLYLTEDEIQTVIEKNKVSIHYNDLIAEKDFSNVFLSL